MEHKYTDSPYVTIPDELLGGYSANGKIPILDWWMDDSRPNGVAWSPSLIQDNLTRFTKENIQSSREGNSTYGHQVTSMLLDSFLKYDIASKRVAVVGSESPWIEAMLLNLKNDVTTIDYNVPDTLPHPGLQVKDYFSYFENNTEQFDCVVSFSSIEHSGLGRYGDPLDPDGDVRTMRTIHKNLKTDGILIWGAPVGHDALVWNVHRVYGKVRLPMIFEGFAELEWFGTNKESILETPLSNHGFQPVVALRKI